MSDQITREEMKAFAEANREHATALSKLTTLVEANGKKLDTTMDIKDDIVETIVGQSDDGSKTTLTAIKKDTSATREDIRRTMFIVASVSLIAAAAAVIANMVFREIQDTKIVDSTMSKYFLNHVIKAVPAEQPEQATGVTK